MIWSLWHLFILLVIVGILLWYHWQREKMWRRYWAQRRTLMEEHLSIMGKTLRRR